MKKIIGLNVVRAMGMALATLTTAAMAVTSPDLPMTGWATQNGNTTGGKGYGEVTVDNVNDLRKYAEAGNKIIYVKPGTYTVPSKSAIKVANNVTIYGYQGAILQQTYTDTKKEDNTVLNITGKNIIIRNLTVKGAGAIDKDAGDCIHVQGGTNVWLDHLDVYDGEDGNLDVINGANYVTISWTKFSYSSKSTEHQFSNLIGNSDDKTSDAGKLKTTMHHNWWADGVKERMPRVRFGQIHVANNLFNSKNANYCVRAGMKADIRVESNVFIGVKSPLDYNNQSTEDAKVSMIGNYYESISGNTTGQGTAFTPSYSMGITDVSTKEKAYALRDSIQLYAGATLPNPGSNAAVTPASSNSGANVTSSSSSAKSSSSVASSAATATSSAATSGAATLTKHGAGSSTQTVAAGSAIDELYFTITGATGATITGLPAGVTGTLKGSDFYISGTVSATAAAGDYKWTVTTTGGSSTATKSGTFTVTAAGSAPIATSSATAASSATVVPAESSADSAPVENNVLPITNPESSSAVQDETVNPEESSSSQGEDSDNPQAIFAATNAAAFSVFTAGRTLSIEGANGKSFAIFDMQGKILGHGRISGNMFVKELPRPGRYLVRVGSMNKTVSVR